MGYTGIAISHLRGHFGMARIDIAIEISTNLSSNPFAVSIFIFRAFRRDIAIDQIDISDAFRRAIGVFGLGGKPHLRHIRGLKIPAITFQNFVGDEDVIRIVVRWHAIKVAWIGALFNRESDVRTIDFFDFFQTDIAVQRIIGGPG